MNVRRLLPILLAGVTLISACKKDDDDDDNNNDGKKEITINSYPQFSGSIDGSEVTYLSTDGYGLGFGVDQAIDTVNNQTAAIYYSALTTLGSDTAQLFTVRIGTLHFPNGSLQENQFVNFFATGSYPYTLDGDEGIEINWRDNDGTIWSTSNGTANQSGSVFVIAEKAVDEDLEGQGFYAVKIRAGLNCKLYDDNGNSKEISDATYVGYFVKY